MHIVEHAHSLCPDAHHLGSLSALQITINVEKLQDTQRRRADICVSADASLARREARDKSTSKYQYYSSNPIVICISTAGAVLRAPSLLGMSEWERTIPEINIKWSGARVYQSGYRPQAIQIANHLKTTSKVLA